jgi:DNA-binding transcriptional MerR regulator
MVDVLALADQVLLEEAFLPASYTSDEEDFCCNLRPERDVDLEDDEIIQILKQYPNKSYRIGDVAEVIGVKVHVIRYWESEFQSFLRPHKTKGGQRLYTSGDIEYLFQIKKLLYNEKYSIAGAKKKLKEMKFRNIPDSVSKEVLIVLKEELEEYCEEIVSHLKKLPDFSHFP